MTDEQKPDDVELEDLVLGELTPEEKNERCRLEDVDPAIMDEMKRLLIAGESVRNMRSLMIAKFGSKDDNVNAAYNTYRRFFNEFRQNLAKDRRLQDELLKAEEKGQALLKELATKQQDIDTPIEDKKTLLLQLFDTLEKRKELYAERNKTFIDPQIEALWISGTREQRMILTVMSELQDKMNVDVMEQMRLEMEVWIDMMVAVVDNTYKQVHKGAEYKTEFMSRLGVNWAEALKNYDHARARRMMQERNKS